MQVTLYLVGPIETNKTVQHKDACVSNAFTGLALHTQ